LLKVWTDKFTESKLEYDVKTYNAKKQSADIPQSQDAQPAKPATASKKDATPVKKAAEAPARSGVKKEDSLSSFTSEENDAKPGKSLV
jgi:hypothetical protein